MAASSARGVLKLNRFSRNNELIYKVITRFYTIEPPEWLGGKSILSKWGKFDFPEHAESFDEKMKKLKLEREKNITKKEPKNIGADYSPRLVDKSEALKISLRNKRNTELEKLSRRKQLQVPIDEVKRDWLIESGSERIKTIAEYYNIYKDLFSGNYFYPVKSLKVHYDYDDDNVTPVYWGNLIPPKEANNPPHVIYDSQSDELWAVLMTNPDGNLSNQEKELIHWLVVNIPGNDLSKGQTLVNYMPPLPPQSTGYHRNVFILFKQKEKCDFNSITRVLNKVDIKNLEMRNFSTCDFYTKYEDILTPLSLAFFQSQWDESVRSYFRDVLEMGEPVYEYDHPTPYHPPAKKYPHKEPFNIYFDRYRDKKDINEEVLRVKLSRTSPFEPRKEALKYPLVHRDPGKYKPSWLRLKEELMARKVDQYKDLE